MGNYIDWVLEILQCAVTNAYNKNVNILYTKPFCQKTFLSACKYFLTQANVPINT